MGDDHHEGAEGRQDSLEAIAKDFGFESEDLQRLRDAVVSAGSADRDAPRPIAADDWEQLLDIQKSCEVLRKQLNSVAEYAVFRWRREREEGHKALDAIETSIENALLALGPAGSGRKSVGLYTRTDLAEWAWFLWRRKYPEVSARIYYNKSAPRGPKNKLTQFLHRLLALAFGLDDQETQTLLRDHVQPILRDEAGYLSSPKGTDR